MGGYPSIEELVTGQRKRDAEKAAKESAPQPKRYLVRAFKSCQTMEDWLNSPETEGYRAMGIADTDDYVTVLLERVSQSGGRFGGGMG
jgi:hypothetical protein